MSDAIGEAFEALDQLVEMAVQHHGQVKAADSYRDTVKAALQSQTAPAVPDGWKLVPVEPTEEMRKRAGLSRGADFYTISKVWDAMLTAAPQPDHSPDAVEYEIRADGNRVRKDRWEAGFRSIVTHTVGPRTEFEIDDIVELVRQKFSPAVNGGSWGEGYEAAIEGIYQPVNAIYSTLSDDDVQLDGDGAAGAIIGEFLEGLSKMISAAGLRFNEDGDAIVPAPDAGKVVHWAIKNPGNADQRRCESRAVRKALGFAPDADDVSPRDLVEAIAEIKAAPAADGGEVEYSQGVCEDGAAILKNGQPMTIEEILTGLRQSHPAQPRNEVQAEALEEYAAALDEVFAAAQDAKADNCPAWHAGQFAKDARKFAERLRSNRGDD